ncbi:NAD(P)-binding protein [Aulographum hederae CBS 113979]|uniref:NAD(P)-binding protein n=1 Tax=Aulographum hederae CBS 113979 TaxID=1176131 RepID=A0A6G1GL42_9PEZI|nr:NAD(P)-binding protein [Aulographum hederae CBS 113979]
MSRALLITGATGKQGGAIIDALLAQEPSNWTILAVTRNPTSPAAQNLQSKSDKIKLVQGDLDDIPTLFTTAQGTANGKIHGVFSVQISMGKNVTFQSEVTQGTNLIDAAVSHGVSHFIYSSVERGGDERSWDNPTPVPHFQTKHQIEHHLRDCTQHSGMRWTILRPVAFMDNLTPGFPSRVFLSAMKSALGHKTMQWIAVSDIGVFAAKAFNEPELWDGVAMGLAGDDLDFEELMAVFREKTAVVMTPVWAWCGWALMWGVKEVGTMVRWFGEEGYAADVGKCRRMVPGLLGVEAWVGRNGEFPPKEKVV